jgi:hypothetical protein
MSTFPARKAPCAECPWRKDVPPGKFPPERYLALAGTAYDMAKNVFACHMSKDEKPAACAGYLSRSADHNLSVRLAYMQGQLEPMDRSGGLALYDDYRALAVANGVEPDNPALKPCR